MEGDKVSREEVASIMHKSNIYAQSNSSLEEDYLKIRKHCFDNRYLS
ncbi:MAG: hypothetical protein HWN70_03820 [Desulfobacterales bacterium]|nr:hypothetical protein [Desulfobacterales bacterium]